jgi:hypothetical protein
VFRLDTDSIVDGGMDALFAAKISLRLDRDVTQQKLDLFQFSPSGVT